MVDFGFALGSIGGRCGHHLVACNIHDWSILSTLEREPIVIFHSPSILFFPTFLLFIPVVIYFLICEFAFVKVCSKTCQKHFGGEKLPNHENEYVKRLVKSSEITKVVKNTGWNSFTDSFKRI